MHFIKLFLAGSFAAAALFRGMTSLLFGPLGLPEDQLMAFFSTPSGMAVETLASFVAGALLAVRISSTKVEKAPRE